MRRLGQGLWIGSLAAAQLACSVQFSAGTQAVTPAPPPAPNPPVARAVKRPAPMPPAAPHHALAAMTAPVHPAVAQPANPTVVRALIGRANRRCGTQEMAPGVFVHIDCKPYKPIVHANIHYGPAKAKLLKAGQLQVGSVASSGAGAPVRSSAPPAGGPMKFAAAATVLPDTVDLRTLNLVGPVKDQGAVGACTAFSLSSVLDGLLRKAGITDTVSPTHLWSHYGSPYMDQASDTNLNRGLTTVTAWPYSGREACELTRESDDDCGQIYNVQPNTSDGDTHIQTELSTADSSGKYRFVSVQRVDTPNDTTGMVQVLASGQPLWAAFRIDSEKWSTRNIVGGVVPDWTNVDGGHALAIVGFRKLPNGSKQFLIQNSWTTQWADQGFAWVSENMVKKQMYYAYKVSLDTAQAPVAPKPATLSDEDCNWDQIVDYGLNQCANICPDLVKYRPNNGQCP